MNEWIRACIGDIAKLLPYKSDDTVVADVTLQGPRDSRAKPSQELEYISNPL